VPSFLEAYLEYTRESEAPRDFHLWSAMAIVGHAVNRRVWLDQHFFKIYPGQLMVTLVADSAVQRKTTAINTAVRLLKQLPEDEINLIVGKHTQAALWDALDRGTDDFSQPRDSIGFIVADELGAFLTKESWAESLATDITQLNTADDGWVARRSRNLGNVQLWNPCLGWLAGTTPSGLAYELPKAAQTAGLFGRMLCIFSQEKGQPNPLIEAPPGMRKQEGCLLRHLYRMMQLAGGFVWDEGAKEFYRPWYAEMFEKAAGSDELTGFIGRKHTHILRVAMILALSAGNTLVLTEPVMRTAEMMLRRVEMLLPEAQRKLGTTHFTEQQDKILSILAREGPLAHGKLASKVWRFCSGDAFGAAVRGLIEAEALTVQRVSNGTQKPHNVYAIRPTRGTMLRAVKINVEDDLEEA
jgi:hypothetical protein